MLRAAAHNGARALGMEDRLGSLEPGRYADLLIVEKERIFFPPGRYDAEPFLDVVIDRAESSDIDTVMVHGRVLMEGGRVTVVDEDALKERFAEAVQSPRLPDPRSRRAMGGARPAGGALRHRLLPTVVRHAGRAGLRLQREGAALLGVDQTEDFARRCRP